MINFFKDFLLNIFLIFAPLVAYPYTYKSQSKTKIYSILIYIFFSFAIVFAMSFPVNLNGLIYDFRSIPLLVGSLYGGIYVSVFLYITLILCRYFLGNPNNLIYAMSIIPTIVLVALLLKRYKQLNLIQKIISAVIICSLIKFLTFVMYLSLVNNFDLLATHVLITIKTYILQGVVIAVFIYLIEFLQKYFHMQEEAIRGEKIKIVSEMAASVAHEIRNPLTSVRGFIQLIGAPNLDQEKKEFYQKISLEELDRAQMIITDYLSIAKPEPEKIEKINLKVEVQYVSNVLLTFANYNNVKMDVSLLCDGRMFILGDRYKLRQSLINIGKNAIEAMSNNGGVLDIKLSEQKNKIVVTISDNGIGMSEEQISRLGTPYFSTKEKGTGLGTMVSFSLIRAMKGKIKIASEMGKGTVFEISFPLSSGS
ncbi:two-component system, sporulation sensor kinase B [Paenibacillus sp. yr247]|uniref:ATP-binding protein n=1 Tax=Paenibacillus sp. yr247 TaxID=1761880 RepID=UPI000880C213|nr:ATP-binding protein [Paenibacillus sp. yr247]SDN04272.1 two-component system, sporulation sensor kinase B [Paenibacillus sp. yr247]